MAQPFPSASSYSPMPEPEPPATHLDFYVQDAKMDPIFFSATMGGGCSRQPVPVSDNSRLDTMQVPSHISCSPKPQPEHLVPPATHLDFYVRDAKEDPIFCSATMGDGCSWQPVLSYSPFETSNPTTAPMPSSLLPTAAPPSTSTQAFWTVDFWRQFFNVDTANVCGRIRSSLWPLQPPEYLATKRLGYLSYLSAQDLQVVGAVGLEPPADLDASQPPGNEDPDLYGPLWISCTLWLTVAMVAQLNQSLNCTDASTNKACQRSWYALVVASGGVISSYQLCVPVGLWAAMRWQGLPVGLVDVVCLYGYSLFVFIPAAGVCILPWSLVQWLALSAAFAVSVLHIVVNLAGVWRQSLASKWCAILFVTCFVLHALLCLAFKYQFFWTL